MSNLTVTDVILLIPGFLAFDRLGKHSYFAETVGTALAANLAQSGPRSFKVVPITVPPVDTLAKRQVALLKAMRDNLKKYKSASIHLVGHSTGGLDAELLTRAKGLDDVAWTKLNGDSDDPRLRLASITTIASPLAGTTLASTPLARILGTGSLIALARALATTTSDGSLVMALEQLTGLLEAAPRLLFDRSVHEILRVPTDVSRLLMFVWNVVRHHGLIFDLRSEYVKKVMRTAEDPLLANISRARFLTVAPQSKLPTAEGKLFDLFYSATQQGAQGAPSPAFLAPLLQRVASGQIRTLAGDPGLLAGLLPRLNPSDSDGIVNTLRQLSPEPVAQPDAELERVVAVVLADHLDVVGYYPDNAIASKNWLTRWLERGTSQNGFLESGAHFRDPQLRALYAAVAANIARTEPQLVAARLASATTSRIHAA